MCLGPDSGVLEWPFWAKLVFVAFGCTGGLIFTYVQCKVYLQLWRRLKAFNRIITVQNCPEKGLTNAQGRTGASPLSRHGSGAVPEGTAPAPGAKIQADTDSSLEGPAAPVQSPV